MLSSPKRQRKLHFSFTLDQAYLMLNMHLESRHVMSQYNDNESCDASHGATPADRTGVPCDSFMMMAV